MIDLSRKLSDTRARPLVLRLMRGALFWKYVAIFVAVMSAMLLTSSAIDIWLTWHEHRSALLRLQQEQAAAAASRIAQYIREIESHLGWTTHLSWSAPAREQRELDAVRLLRQVPAISELTLLDAQGREQLRVSRQAMDLVASNSDFSNDERFKTAISSRVYYGPVYFRRASEPFMTLAVSGTRRDAGVSVAEVNLAHIWDVIQTVRVGRTGRAWVVGPEGRLIAHPDISLVLRNTDLSELPQVRAARQRSTDNAIGQAQSARDVHGARVLTAFAHVEPMGWQVFVELPEQEANEPLYAAITRTLLIAIAGLVLTLIAALLLARRMVVPIRVLTAGAAQIGSGALDHRIRIETGDELETLGSEFNRMASQLQTSYATLEGKVEERTAALQLANFAKSRFLAIASHDLRQPLHALNLLIGQLRTERDLHERTRVVARIETAVADMNELFNALLDISKLDAGAMTATICDFPVADVLRRIEATFAAAARDRGLHFAVVVSSVIIRSDPILIERILLNLVSNAVRYTGSGGVVLGCRRRGDLLRIDVCDSGIGIAAAHQRSIFAEFYRGPDAEQCSGEGLGLGLAIVERLCRLLDHPIDLASRPGRGSRFSVTVPLGNSSTTTLAPAAADPGREDQLRDKLIVVIDDDTSVLESTAGLLRSWGCRVVAATSDQIVLAELGASVPDLIISDYRLRDGRTGIEAIADLRSSLGSVIPAFIVSGDIAPGGLSQAQANGLRLLHKPVAPIALRAITSRLLKDGARPSASTTIGA